MLARGKLITLYLSEREAELGVEPMAQHPVVPKPRVVIRPEGVNPAKLHLPRAFDITTNYSGGSDAVFGPKTQDIGLGSPSRQMEPIAVLVDHRSESNQLGDTSHRCHR